MQRRKKSTQETTTVEKTSICEDNWGLWGEWIQENADTWVRSRACKVPGTCTGNSVQRRKKSAQETTTVEDIEETPVDDYWGAWGQWTLESATSEVRKRDCKVPGKCTGNAVQKRQKAGVQSDEGY